MMTSTVELRSPFCKSLAILSEPANAELKGKRIKSASARSRARIDLLGKSLHVPTLGTVGKTLCSSIRVILVFPHDRYVDALGGVLRAGSPDSARAPDGAEARVCARTPYGRCPPHGRGATEENGGAPNRGSSPNGRGAPNRRRIRNQIRVSGFGIVGDGWG